MNPLALLAALSSATMLPSYSGRELPYRRPDSVIAELAGAQPNQRAAILKKYGIVWK